MVRNARHEAYKLGESSCCNDETSESFGNNPRPPATNQSLAMKEIIQNKEMERNSLEAKRFEKEGNETMALAQGKQQSIEAATPEE
ncbi:hypothetical protein P3S67_029771 [Capsicum chacoense]